MKRNLCFIILFCVFGATIAFPQKEMPQPISQIPEEVEPFKIKRGSSFSASGSHPKPVVAENLPDIGRDKVVADFSQAIAIIRKNHVNGKTIDLNEVTKSSIDGMLRTLDPHSNYFDSVEYQNLLEEQRSEYFGIGASIANYVRNGETNTFILATFPGSPAAKGNLRFGDKILAVNGENMSGKTSDIVRDKIRGRSGTVVRMSIERADTRAVETIELRRNRVPQPSIPDAYLLRPGIGYVDLTSGFNFTTFDELDASMKELHRQGMTSMILDLRGNTGGILDQAVKVAEKFLPAGTVIVTQRGRFRIDLREWKSNNKSAETMPLVVLVDEASASASEVVAGALQDYDRALIIGEKTFGKGLVQSVINLPYGSGLTLTTAKYYTPSGRSIQRDYSKVNLYDYFNHRNGGAEPDKNRFEARTVTNRKVFGGDGIMPDETVKNADLNETQISLLDPMFFFTREVASGRVKGFERYKITGRSQYGQRLKRDDFPVTESLLTAFRQFVEKDPSWKISARLTRDEATFIKLRLRFNLVIAGFGTVSANQVLTEEDPQIAKAVEALPRAQQLALAASKTRMQK